MNICLHSKYHPYNLHNFQELSVCALAKLETLSVAFFDLLSHTNLTGLKLSQLEKKILTFNELERSYIEALAQLQIRSTAGWIDIQKPKQRDPCFHHLDALDLEMPKIPSFLQHSPALSSQYKKFFLHQLSTRTRSKIYLIQLMASELFSSLKFFKGSLVSFETLKKNIKLTRNYPLHLPRSVKNFILCQTISELVFSEERLIGEGTYGKVFLVKKNDQLLALKKFKGMDGSEENAFAEMLVEGGLHCLIPFHPSIIQIEAISMQGIFFEYGDRGILANLFQDDQTQYPSILSIFQSIAKGLFHIHSQGFIYKDLKSNNIIIFSFPPFAKICDLGFLTENLFDDDDTVCPLIAAPEIFFSKDNLPFSGKIDVWAFGVLLYQTLALGQYPFYHLLRNSDRFLPAVASYCYKKPCTVKALLSNQERKIVKNIQQKDPEGFLIDLVAQCLHGDPEERISMEDILERLNDLSIGFVGTR